jgi:hypothetical protein
MPLQGYEEARANFERIMLELWMAAAQAMEAGIIGKIVPECVDESPVDTGTMQASIPECSGMISLTNHEAVVEIGAGNSNINPKSKTPCRDYTPRQHEDLMLHHRYGKAKFIEDPCERNKHYVPGWIMEAL